MQKGSGDENARSSREESRNSLRIKAEREGPIKSFHLHERFLAANCKLVLLCKK